MPERETICIPHIFTNVKILYYYLCSFYYFTVENNFIKDEVRKLTDELDRLSLASTQSSNQTNSATTQYRDNNSGNIS